MDFCTADYFLFPIFFLMEAERPLSFPDAPYPFALYPLSHFKNKVSSAEKFKRNSLNNRTAGFFLVWANLTPNPGYFWSGKFYILKTHTKRSKCIILSVLTSYYDRKLKEGLKKKPVVAWSNSS